ncbi:hypothetical protein BC938DRAFT_471499 [Jimgerdemannia flammicorona]|uniref:Uncharacterized protein n=1 Tax=Jimgerdemannia flammicorona TaxID=994334 RepID=A0A433Q801_9FUNG|nr:hypothetical protein BC938DRAFT_471499 [Jimgerdemannia flammicorona]
MTIKLFSRPTNTKTPNPARSLPTQQAQRVQPQRPVFLDPVVEAVRPPRVCKEDDGDGLPKVVELQPTRADGVHD